MDLALLVVLSLLVGQVGLVRLPHLKNLWSLYIHAAQEGLDSRNCPPLVRVLLQMMLPSSMNRWQSGLFCSKPATELILLHCTPDPGGMQS